MFDATFQNGSLSIPSVIDLSAVRVRQAWVLTVMRKDGPAIVRMLWRLLGREDDVLDAYQDCFCKLIAYADREKIEPARSFIFRVAMNAARDIGRKRQVRAEHLPTVMAEWSRRNLEKSGSDAGAGLLVAELRVAIETLPERLREVIVLRDLAELPYRDVARLLRITSGTARVYRREAIVALAEKMGASGQGREYGIS